MATADDEAHNPAECSNRGVCDYSRGHCQCDDGYEGLACQRMACPNDCSGAGTCITMQRLARREAHLDGPYRYSQPWDASKIVGCVCDAGAEGYDCSQRSCPLGDDPLTTGQVDEKQFIGCNATGGTFSLILDGKHTEPIAADGQFKDVKRALEPIAGDVEVLGADPVDTQPCHADGALFSVQFLQRHGDVPALRFPEDVLVSLEGTEVGIFVRDGVDDTNDVEHPRTGDTYQAVQGTKEWLPCSNRGRCNVKSGDCHCFKGFGSSDGRANVGTKGDCGKDVDPITSCPGKEVECSGHGVCSGSPEYTCDCHRGWTGGDCGERTCPEGFTWFGPPSDDQVAHDTKAECSNRGHCNREDGECQCESGFTGAACDRTVCPTDEDSQVCSGHGRCASMHKLAEFATDNGVPTPFRYGSQSPGDPQTWDAFRMFGCFCDEGFEGFDCSLRSCPTGDDPKTPGDFETQELFCELDDGSFTLDFRGETTESIDFDSKPSDFKLLLEALDTIGTVRVECDDGKDSAICSASGNACRVTFLTELGDLPSLEVDPPTGDVTVRVDGDGGSVRGTKDNAECSNRGVCDYDEGKCKCFPQYGSSDGDGNTGDRGDCGHLLPFVPLPHQQSPREKHRRWDLKDW